MLNSHKFQKFPTNFANKFSREMYNSNSENKIEQNNAYGCKLQGVSIRVKYGKKTKNNNKFFIHIR